MVRHKDALISRSRRGPSGFQLQLVYHWVSNGLSHGGILHFRLILTIVRRTIICQTADKVHWVALNTGPMPALLNWMLN